MAEQKQSTDTRYQILDKYIDSFTVSKNGFDYAVGDPLVFDNTLAGGSGVSAEVSEILGKTVTSISVLKTKETDFDVF